jgi:anti-sigma regulatory factor (Ser/Thr protein kinase)
MTYERSFPMVSSSVPAARHFAEGTLAELPEDFVALVTLMVSELATNAVRHGATPFSLCIDLERDTILVQVRDNGHGGVTVRRPGSAELSGRGLQVVAKLADEWGVLPASRDWTNTVWFRIHVPAAALV